MPSSPALKHGGHQRNMDVRAQQIAAVLRIEQLAAPAPVTAAFGTTTRAAVGIIIELNRQITELEAELRHILRHTRTPTSTSACQDLGHPRRPGAR